jgi:hypothetical protein
VIFSITPHSASCERLFSALGWLFGKRRVNLGVETVESMAKIYLYSLNNSKKDLNYTDSKSENDIKQMINIIFDDEEFLNENDDDNDLGEPSEPQPEEIDRTDQVLNIEEIIDLGPWIFIDNSVLPTISRKFDSSDDDEDWDPENLN